VDKNILNKIIQTAEVKPGERVLEIGAGIGTVTLALLREGAWVLAIEKDKELVSFLDEATSPFSNIKIISGDFLQMDIHTLLNESYLWKVVSNPPYNIVSPLLFKLIQFKEKFSSIVLMLQRELADRLIASVGCKDYSFLTIKVQYHLDVETIHKVSRRVFFPIPKVDSTLLRLKPLQKPRIKVSDEECFFKVADAIFKMRRKNLKNSLKILQPPENFWEECPFDLRRRGETLSLEEIGILSDTLIGSWKKKSGR